MDVDFLAINQAARQNLPQDELVIKLRQNFNGKACMVEWLKYNCKYYLD